MSRAERRRRAVWRALRWALLLLVLAYLAGVRLDHELERLADAVHDLGEQFVAAGIELGARDGSLRAELDAELDRILGEGP